MVRVSGLLILATVARYASQLASVSILVRTVGDLKAGTYLLALAIGSPVFVVLSLGLRNVLLTLGARARFSVYVKVRVISSSIAAFICVGVSVFTPRPLSIAILCVCAIKFADSFNDLLSAESQRRGLINQIPLFAIATAAASLSLLSLAAVSGLGFTVCLLAYAAGSASVTFFVMCPYYARVLANRDDQPDFSDKGAARSIVNAGFAVGISMGLVALLAAVPQYLLASVLGPIASGRYALIAYILVTSEIVMNGVAQAWIPVARARHQQGSLSARYVGNIATKASLALGVAYLVGLPVASVVYSAAFGPRYDFSIAMMVPMLFSGAILPIVFISNTALAVQNLYSSIFGASAVALLGCLIGGLLLIPTWGVPGALWCNVVAMTVRAAASLYPLRRSAQRDRSIKDASLSTGLSAHT